MSRSLLLLLAACALPHTTPAPPPPLSLDIGPLVPGASMSSTVTGAAEGDTVWIAATGRGAGAGPCPPALGGQCLGILRPTMLGPTTSIGGQAVGQWPVPATVPEGTEVCVQAGVIDSPALLSNVACRQVAQPVPSESVGPFDLTYLDGHSPAVTLYVVVPPGAERIGVRVDHAVTWRQETAVARIFDPDENLVASAHIDTEEPGFAMTNGALIDLEHAHPRAGVWQIRVSTRLASEATFTVPQDAGYGVLMSPGTFKAWSGMPSNLYAFVPRHPTRTLQWTLSAMPDADRDGTPDTPWSIVDTTDGSSTSATNGLTMSLPPGTDEGVVHRWDVPPDMRMRVAGLPLILASDEDTARTLHNSMERVDGGPMDGFLVPHKYQRRIAEDLLPALLDHAGDSAQLVAMGAQVNTPACTQPATLGEALRSRRLLQLPLQGVVWALDHQVLDPTDPWAGGLGMDLALGPACSTSADCPDSGACGAGGVCETFDTRSTRWDLQRPLSLRWNATRMSGLYGGLKSSSHLAYEMFVAATLDDACNPYRPVGGEVTDAGLRLAVRATANSLANLLVVQEDERMPHVGTDPYPGHPAFVVGGQLLPEMGQGAPLARELFDWPFEDTTLGEAISEVWVDATRRQRDRYWSDYLVSAMNQSAHFLRGFEHFAQGSDALADYELSRRYAERFIREAAPAGWWPEATGPSPSYAGMQHYFTSTYLRLTEQSPLGRHEAMRDAIAASYDYFIHSAAPEPDGRWFAGFAHGHRIATGTHDEQFSGGRGIVHDVQQVSLRDARANWDLATLSSELQSVANGFQGQAANAHNIALGYELRMSRAIWQDPDAWTTDPTLPVERGSFTRWFGNEELLSVSRPDWFGSFFLEGPSSSWYTNTYQCDLRLPRDEETSGAGIDIYTYTPFSTGGLLQWWTPDFGTSLLSTNWSPRATHGPMAVFSGARSGFDAACPRTSCTTGCSDTVQHHFWPTYQSTEVDQFDGTVLVVRNTIPGPTADQSLTQVRTTTLHDDRMEVTVELLNEGSTTFSADALVENLPFLTCDANCATSNIKRDGATLTDSSGVALSGTGVWTEVHLVDDLGRGVALTVSGASSVEVEPNILHADRYGDHLQIGRVGLVFGTSLAPGASTSVSYTLRAL